MQNGQNESDASGSQDAGAAAEKVAQKGAQAAKDAAGTAKDAGKLVASGGTDVKSWITLFMRLKKYLLPVLAFFFMLFLIIILGFLFLIMSLFIKQESARASTCTNGGPTSMSIIPTNGIVNIGYKTTHPLANRGTWEMTPERMAVAQEIVRAGLNRQPPVPDNGITIAIATALVEANLDNPSNGDGSSVGAFQLIKIHEPPVNRMVVSESAKWFYDGLLAIPNKTSNSRVDEVSKNKPWYEIPPGTAAQAVQGSAFPGRYQQVIGLAASITQTILDAMRASGTIGGDTPQAAPPSGLYILGDSITVALASKYKEVFNGRGIAPAISAVSGRSWITPGNPSVSEGTKGTGQQAVQTDKEIIATSGSIVIALGTNGGLPMNPVDEIYSTIQSINPGIKIYWINIASSQTNVSSYVVPFNTKLSELEAAGKITVIDWAQAVDPGGNGTRDPSGLLSDGVHPNEKGKTKLAEIVSSTYLEVIPPGCEGFTGLGGDPSQCPADSQFNETTYRLKDGSSPHELCVKSVQQARSPESGKAIIWAFQHVGIPYGQGPNGNSCTNTPTRTGPTHYDCSGFVTSAYSQTGTNVGGNPPTATMRAGWSSSYKITKDQALPGDLLLPNTGHVVMLLADGNMVHTNRCGDVSHVKKRYEGSLNLYLAVRTPTVPGP